MAWFILWGSTKSCRDACSSQQVSARAGTGPPRFGTEDESNQDSRENHPERTDKRTSNRNQKRRVKPYRKQTTNKRCTQIKQSKSVPK